MASALILEDDCFRSSFFPFCEDLLERYAQDREVAMIGAMQFPLKHPKEKIVNTLADRYVQEEFFEGITHWQRLYWKLRLLRARFIENFQVFCCCLGPGRATGPLTEILLGRDTKRENCFCPNPRLERKNVRIVARHSLRQAGAVAHERRAIGKQRFL